MFKNVLVGVDGSSNGRDAIALASRLVEPGGAITLAHVHGGGLHPSHVIAPGHAKEEGDASQRLLEEERAAADLEASLLSIAAKSPGRGLHQQAETQHADLLVVGSSSRGAVGRAMLGDDTRAALNGAPCAVAVATLGYAAHAAPIASIGVGYTASPEGEAALALGRELAATTGARLEAREVVSIPPAAYTGMVAPGLGDTIESMLAEAQTRMDAMPGVTGTAVYGLTGEELSVFGEHLDVLIVGSRGYGPVKRLVLGSTSDYLQRHGRCSLIVLPRPEASDHEQAGGESDLAGVPG